MNYTTNYKLPQWEEIDRIQMEDFNAAMANIEEGLNVGEQNRADTALTLEQEMLTRLRKVGYDLYQSAARNICAGVIDNCLKGSVLNCMKSSEELSRITGMLHMDGGGCMIGTSTGMTLAKLNAAIYSWENGTASSVSAAATAKVSFRSSFRGTIKSLGVWYNRTSSVSSAQLSLYVRLYDLTTSSYAYKSDKLTSAVLGAVDTAETLTVSIPVEPHHNYRLELYTSGSVFSGTIGFGTKGTEALTGTVTGSPMNSGALSESTAQDVPAAQAVAVLHYSGGSQAPTVTVNGTAMAVSASRAGTSLRGSACTELELLLEGELTGTLALGASFQTSGTDMTVHDIQFYFI